MFILFRVRNGIWTRISEEGPGDLAFDSSGEGWLCIGGGLYHIDEETVDLISDQDFTGCRVEVDPAGRVWMTIRGPVHTLVVRQNRWRFSDHLGGQ